MKKILQINSVLNIGSTGRIVEQIGLLAINNGYESYVAFGRYMNYSQSKAIRIGSKAETYVHGAYSLLDMHGFGSKNATMRLIKKIKMIQPNLIHLHNIHGYYLNIRLLFNFLAVSNIPVVWTFHDCWPFTGHCAYYSFIACDKWKTQCYECPQINKYPKSFVDRSETNYNIKNELFNSVKKLTIVPVSKWLEREIKLSFLGKHRICQIYNGIDTKLFRPDLNYQNLLKKYGLRGKTIILGVANIWDSRKGLKDFLELNDLLEDNEQIVLIGLSNTQIKLLPEGILGIQRTNDVEELAMFYNSALVFVNPTWEDNFPTTNIEAQSCGTPVITYDSGGSGEAITNNTGFVIEKGNIRELHKSIKKIEKLGKEYFGTFCRDHVLKYFNKDEKFKEYINLYDSLM